MPVDPNAPIRITAFAWVPEFAQGFVKDLRVRWALEEAGLPYSVRLITQGEQDAPEYRAVQPFGQVPVFEEDGIVLFESGAIVHHIGERSEALLPRDPGGRARALQWMFAALNSIEPFVAQLRVLDLFYTDETWAKLRRPGLEAFVRRRVAALSDSLGEKRYLDGERFTAGDLMVATVLRDLSDTDMVSGDRRLNGYLERCLGRPAFRAALAAQLTDFQQNETPAAA
jgi:glutathione S-transferase